MYRFITSNVRKTYLFLAVIFALIILIGYFLSWYFSDFSLLIGALIFALFYNLLAYFGGNQVVLIANGAKEINKKDLPELYNLIENMSIQLGLPTPKIYVMNEEMPNAFACGRDPNHSSIAVTKGLLDLMERKELEGVLAHEFSHIKNYDIRLATIVAVLVGAVVILVNYMGRFFWFSDEDNNRGIIGLIILIITLILAPIAVQMIQLAISRRREFLADASSVEITRFPQGLISALQKIEKSPRGIAKAPPATAHLYFASPFKASKKQSSPFANLFSTHPPINERIKALKKMGF